MRLLSRLIIVRRGDDELCRTILHSSNRWPPGTALMIDRRERERRVLRQQVIIERRHRQRRAEPNANWRWRGFLVVGTDRLPAQALLLDTTPAN
jgi:hypothetical protein